MFLNVAFSSSLIHFFFFFFFFFFFLRLPDLTATSNLPVVIEMKGLALTGFSFFLSPFLLFSFSNIITAQTTRIFTN